MSTITVTGQTVDLAIEKGLKELNVSREQVLIVVLQEGKKGIFGIGRQEALVSLTEKPKPTVVNNTVANNEVKVTIEEVVETPQEEKNIVVEKVEEIVVQEEATAVSTEQTANEKYKVVVDYLVAVSKEYGADITVDVKETAKKLVFQIETQKAGLLIGKYGKIINALQVLTQTMVYREDEKAPMVIVNIGDYRQKREEKLKEMADRTAKKVLRTRQAVYLEPLPAFERKIVHARISQYDKLVTQSEGKEPHRYLKVEFNQNTY